MDCHEAEDLLVAHQDEELSRSATKLIEDHLAGCQACAALYERLEQATPHPEHRVPPHILQHLAQSVQVDRVLAAAKEPARARATPWGAWWRRDTEVSRWVVFAYTAALALSVGWGMSNWYSLTALQTRLNEQHASGPSPLSPTTELPAEQYRPAAYSPEDDEGYH